MSALICTKRIFSFMKRTWDTRPTQTRNGYIVLLPEVDPSIAETIFSTPEELPNFSNLTSEQLGMIMGKTLLEFECAVRNFDRKVEISPDTYDLFEDIIHPLEKQSISFKKTWGIIRTLYLTDSKKMPQATFYNLNSRVQTAYFTKYSCMNIYALCKKINKSDLTEEQSRLVDKHLIEGNYCGFDCKQRNRYLMEYKSMDIMQFQAHFRLRLDTARNRFYLTFNDPILAREFPDSLLKKMAISDDFTTGPWTVKLTYGISDTFLEYCPDRDLRFSVWHAEDKVASSAEDERSLSNGLCCEQIRHFRDIKATLLGYPNYFEMLLKTKMAENLDEINSLLSSYLKEAKAAQLQEILMLQEFADKQGCQHPIQLWDVPYWTRKQKWLLYNYENEQWRNYFPLYKVMNGLFALCDRLFGVTFEEVHNVDSWNPEVRFFNVFEPHSDKPVGGFYFDPYAREDKLILDSTAMDIVPIKGSSRVNKPITPVTALIMNLQPPFPDRPSLLSFEEVKNLFSMFGYNLQILLSKTTYCDLSGINFVERDAYAVCSKFMINWLYEQRTFESIHEHYETGEKLQNVDLLGLRRYFAGFKLCQEVYKSNMDIRMHSEKKHWRDLAQEMWDDHFVFPLSNYNSDPCKYLDIFSGQLDTVYYGHIWSDMLAADIFNAFFEPHGDHAIVGARFRDTYLTFGGSCTASETFRRFRGRDPCPEALLNNLGLIEIKLIREDEEIDSEQKANPEKTPTVDVVV